MLSVLRNYPTIAIKTKVYYAANLSEPALFAFYLKNTLSPCIGRMLDSSTSAGSSRGAMAARFTFRRIRFYYLDTVTFRCIIAAIIRGGPTVELSAVAGCFLLAPRMKQFNFLFVHYRRANLNSAPICVHFFTS